MKKDYPGINNITKPVFDALMHEIKNINSRYDINTYLTEDNCELESGRLEIFLPNYLMISQAYDTKRLIGGILLLNYDSSLIFQLPTSNGISYEDLVYGFSYGNINGSIIVYIDEGIDNVKDAIQYVKENIKFKLEDLYIAGSIDL